MSIDKVRLAAARLVNIGRASRLESEMEHELQFHLQMQTEQFVQAGLTPREARRRALVDLGGLEKTREACREALGIRLMRDFFQDIRYAIRVLTRSPGFTLVAVLTLAIGIGANTAVFSVVNTLLLQPLPFDDPDRIVMLWEKNAEIGYDKEQVGWGDFFDWQEKSASFDQMGYIVSNMAISRNFMLTTGDDATRIRGRHVSSGLFDLLGVEPLLGQTLSAEDDKPSGLRRAVLSHSLWDQAFGADPNIVGQSLDVGRGETFEVIGVMPPSFRFPQDAEVWLSVAGFRDQRSLERSMASRSHGLWAIGRLKDGISVRQASGDLNTIQRQIYEAPENQNIPRLASGVTVTPLLDQVNGSETGPALLLLLGAVAFVLLIACANVANLLLARAMSRRREMAIRASLGAGRLRVVRQLLTESLILSLLGAAAAVLIAIWGIQLLELIRTELAWLSVKEFRFDRFGEVHLDLRVLGFTVLISVLTGVLFGLIPSVQASRLNVNEALKEDSRSGTPGRATRVFRNGLLIAEVSLALVLLAGTSVTARSFARMLAVDPGLDAENVLRAELDLDMAEQVYGTGSWESHDEVLRRLEALPGVESVSSVGELPATKSGWNDTFRIVGPEHENLAPNDYPSMDIRLMSPGVFETLRIPLLAGRDFTDTDTRDSPRVAIVNRTFAEKHFPGSDPVGRQIQFRGWQGRETEIVGVVGNVRNYSDDSSDLEELYYPFRQSFMGGAEVGPVVLIRTSGSPDNMISAIRHVLDGPDPRQQVLIRFRKLQDVLDMSASQERFQTVLLAAFSAIAVLLAVVGVYGVMSYSTAQRTQEIGIRLALGAQPAQVLKSIVGQGATLCVTGIVIGIGIAAGLGRLLSRLVYGLESIDLPTLVLVSLGLLAVGMAASFIPARRAMRINPLDALRHQ